MNRYTALLGGINVGSHRVKMEELRQLFSELGFSNVGTYIASGNVFFNSNEVDTDKLEGQIEEHLEANLGYAVPTFIRTVSEIESLLENSPFNGKTPEADERFCVMFLGESLATASKLPISSSKKDMDIVATGDRAIFVVWRIINGRPPSGSFEKGLLPAKCSTRFFHTLVKIVAAAKK